MSRSILPEKDNRKEGFVGNEGGGGGEQCPGKAPGFLLMLTEQSCRFVCCVR